MDNENNQNKKPHQAPEQSPDITIEEKIPSKLLSSLPQLAEAIQKLDRSGIAEMVIDGQKHYKGPLPFQLLEKLDKDQCDKIIDDMIQTKQKNIENQSKFMESVFKDQGKQRLHSTIKYIFTAIVGLGIFLTLVFTGNVEILKEYLSYLFAFIVGSGVVLYNVSKKKNKTPGSDEEYGN